MARSEEQNQKMRDERKEQILSSALKLFAYNGLAGTKISNIVKDAKISQGLVYHYFKSKEEIYFELINNAFEKMNFAATELEKSPLTPKEKITKAIAAMLDSIQNIEDFSRTFLLIAQATASDNIPKNVRETIKSKNKVPYDVVTKIMKAGQKDKSIKKHDPEELSLMFWTMIKGLAFHKVAHKDSFKAPDIKLLTSMFLLEE